MEKKKYKLDYNDSISVRGHRLYRIISLVDMPFVAKGDKGGYIESEDNLSHSGDAWVFSGAKVYGNAMVCNNAHVFGLSKVCGNARVFGDARVHEEAKVYGNAKVFGNAHVRGNSKIYGNAEVYGRAIISEEVQIYKDAKVSDSAYVYGNARICGEARVCGDSQVSGIAHIHGSVVLYGMSRVSCDAYLGKSSDYFCAQSFGSQARTTTFFRGRHCWFVSCGCFTGSIEQFRKKVKETHRNTIIAKEYLLLADLMELRMKRKK